MIGWCGKDCDDCDAMACMVIGKRNAKRSKVRTRNIIKAVMMRKWRKPDGRQKE